MATNTHSSSHSSLFARIVRTRGSAIFLLLLVVAPLYTVRMIGGAHARANAVELGLGVSYWDGLSSHDVDRWPGVAPGDALVGINGTQFDLDDFRRTLYTVVKPGAANVTIARGGELLTFHGTATQKSLFSKVAIWSRVLQAISLLLMGLVAFALSPGRTSSWLFLGFTSLCSFYLSSQLVLDFWPTVNLCMSRLSGALGASLGVHLFLVFPSRLRWLTRTRLRLFWVYLVPIVTGPILFVSYPRHQYEIARPTAIVMTTWLAVGTVLMCFSLYSQLKKARATGDEVNKARCRVLVVALFIGGMLPAIWNGYFLVFTIKLPNSIQFLNSSPVVILVALMTYTLVRHNALEIDRFTRALVGYSATIALLGLLVSGVFVGIPLVLEESGVVRSSSVLLGATMGAFVLSQPLYRRIRKKVDRWFFRDSGDEKTQTRVLAELSRAIASGERDIALREALAAAMTLQPDRAEIWLLDDDGENFNVSTGVGEATSGQVDSGAREAIPIARRGALGTLLAQRSEALRLRTGSGAVSHDRLWQFELALALPVEANGLLSGFLAVGRKKSGTDYDNDEVVFLEGVAAQIGLALEIKRDEIGELGRYRIERRLGVGGMAEVFLAWQLGPGGFERKVALKRPLPHFAEDQDAINMFLDEARIASQLHHKNIMQVYEVDEEVNGGYFMAMEFVDGPSLRTLLKSRVAVPAPVVLQIIDSMLAALSHAHSLRDASGAPMKVVHRDVTPGNILIGKDGEAKLVDFGIARAAEKLHITETGVAKGTLPYMCPEQAGGRAVDRRADLYSIGAVCYEMLTGVRAYPGGRTSRELPPTPVSVLPPVYEVVVRALSYEPERRFADAEAMRLALRAANSGSNYASAEEVAAWVGQVAEQTKATRRIPRKPLPTVITKPDRPDQTKQSRPRTKQTIKKEIATFVEKKD